MNFRQNEEEKRGAPGLDFETWDLGPRSLLKLAQLIAGAAPALLASNENPTFHQRGNVTQGGVVGALPELGPL